MTRFSCRTILVSLTLSVVAGASPLAAQVCHGTPPRGGIAFEHGELSTGTSTGVNLAWAGRGAFDATLRQRNLDNDRSGQEANVRFALTIGSKIQFCPGIGLGFGRDEWDAGDGFSLTSNQLTGRAGIGVGMEQPLVAGISLIPFVVAQYEFTAIEYDVDAPANAETEVTGDTLSHVDFEYGLMARFKILYGGIAAQRNTEVSGTRPYMARYVLGLTFGSGSKAARRRTR